RQEAQQIAAAAAELEGQGLAVTTDWPGWDWRGSAPLPLDRLSTRDGTPLTVETHADCPGHAASLRVVSVEVITDRNGNTLSSWDAEELLQEEMERRDEQWCEDGGEPDDEPQDVDPAELGLTSTRGRDVEITWVCTQHITHADHYSNTG